MAKAGMMNVPKIVLIGCGTVARRYYVPALKRYPEFIGGLYLADVDRKCARETRALLGGGTVLEDYRDALDDARGAVILLPSHLHHAAALDCLKAGVHVLCEKPLAVLPDHAGEMVRTARENRVALCVNNTRRMFPSFRWIREAVDSGMLGALTGIEYTEGSVFGWPSETGFSVNPKVSSKGILLDLGAHVIDTVCWWAGGRPELVEMKDDSYGGPESVVKIRAKKDRCEIRITLNRLCELGNRYLVTGERGRVEGGIFDWRRVGMEDGTGGKTTKKLPCASRNYPSFTIPIVDNFLAVIKGQERPLISGSDVLPSIEFIHECYEKRERLDLSWDRDVRIFPVSGGARERNSVKRILVTGATGFIGGRIVEMAHLAREKNLEVSAGIHQWSSAARLGRVPARTSALDLMNPDLIERALENVTHVIHCAKGLPEATVEGTRNLLEACLGKGIRHVIHLSSADVYGDAEGVVDEDSPYQYTGNPYNRMKIDAEKVCREYQDRGLPLTVFRPSIVYGPFSANWSLRFAAMFLAGEGGVYEGHGKGRCNLVYVDDLVRTMLGALDNQDTWGRAFNINGPDVITWNEYFSMLNAALGLPPLRIIRAGKADAAVLAMAPVRALGGFVKRRFLKPVKMIAERVELADALMRKLERRVKTTPSADELRLFSKDVVYSDARARSALSCCPDTGIDRGMAHTLEWVRYLGLVS